MTSRLARHLRAYHEVYWAPLVYAAILAFLYRPIFLTKGSVGFGWDTIESYWPDLSFLAHKLRVLDWPLWNPFEKGGSPYFANPERGEYYPVNWLFATFGALRGDVPWWLGQAKQLSHHLIAALTMHAFLRSRDLPRSAALVGGSAWVASAPLLIHKASSVLWPMVWVPLIWLAADRCIAHPNWRRGVFLGAAVALAGSSGSPPGFFYALLLALPYGVWKGCASLWTAHRQGNLVAAAKRLGLAVAVGALVTFAWLWVSVAASAQLTSLSQRAELTLAYALSFPLPAKSTFLGFIAPLSGKWDSYVGGVVLMLAAVALASRPRRDNSIAFLWLGLALLFTLLSFGGSTPLLPWLVKHVPGFGLFRASNRYKLLAVPCLAALAGYGAGALVDLPKQWSAPRLRACVAIAIVIGGVIAAALITTPQLHPKLPGRFFGVELLALGAAIALASLLAPPRIGRWLPFLLAPLVVFDPQRYVTARDPALEPAMNNQEDRQWLEGLADVSVDWRIYDEFVLEQRAGSRLGIREFRGYPAGGSLEYQRYADILRVAKTHPEILEAFNIRYVFHGPHHRAGTRANHLRRPPSVSAPQHFRRLRPHVFEALHPQPLVSWFGAVTMAKGPGMDTLAKVLATEGPDGIRRSVVLEPSARSVIGSAELDKLIKASAAPPSPTRGAVSVYEANRVVAEINAPAAGIVVLDDAMYPGWKARVDGKPQRVFFANGFVRGVFVGPGHHRVEWRFRPANHGFRLLALFAAFLAIILAATPPRQWRQRR